MPKALVVEENQLRHLVKVTAVSGESPLRNVALVYVLYGTGMMLTEVGSITVRDYLREDGAVRVSSEVRAAIAYNSNARALHWSSPRVDEALDAYLAGRVRLSHGLTVRKAAFRGLDPDGQLFRRGERAVSIDSAKDRYRNTELFVRQP
jgi:site-specific recombinase XerD